MRVAMRVTLVFMGVCRLFQFFLFLSFAFFVRGQTLQTVHSFHGSPYGANPSTGLTEGMNGAFYGATSRGGLLDHGTIYLTSTNGGEATTFSFNESNGSRPIQQLVRKNQYFYGITRFGGAFGEGTFFKTQGGNQIAYVSFDGTNGLIPTSVVLGADGQVYGTTMSGGASNRGTIVQWKEPTFGQPSLALVKIFDFGVSDPRGPVIKASDGNFYGTSSSFGESNLGAIFRITTNGTLATLFSFNGTNGAAPLSLVEDTNGCFYGVTQNGGAANFGTIFKIDTAGNFTSLFSFSFYDGSKPRSLLISKSGDIFGTTSEGPYGDGTVFRLSPNGRLTTLAVFKGSNGSGPGAGLVEKDGYLYGAAISGGTVSYPGYGTIFKISIPPLLNSAVRNGSDLILSWPTNAVTFTLQSAADLNSPTNWNDVTNPPAIVDGQFTVTNSIYENARFYRLKK